MIYDTKTRKVFNDSYVRAVDNMVDQVLFGSSDNRLYGYYEKYGYQTESKTIFVHLPRQSGKTTYLCKLKRALSDKGYNTLLITRDTVTAKQLHAEFGIDCWSISSFNTEARRGNGMMLWEVILYDEIGPLSVKEYGSKLTLGLYTGAANKTFTHRMV